MKANVNLDNFDKKMIKETEILQYQYNKYKMP